MEKQGIIKEGLTPEENKTTVVVNVHTGKDMSEETREELRNKLAKAFNNIAPCRVIERQDLEDHITKRASDLVEKELTKDE